jgi:hypothetical protein
MYAILFGVLLLVLFWGWIGLFFARVRPAIMARVGRGLDVRVAESADIVAGGTYDVAGPSRPLGKSLAVMAADFVVLLLGTVGVAALIFVPTFIAAERGWFLPIEGKLTGRSATLRIIGFAKSPVATKAKFTLVAENTGEVPLVDCLVVVDTYTARTGYMQGVSVPFDLMRGSPRTLDLEVESLRPPTGEGRFRLEMECAAERVAVAEGTLQVR